MNRIHNKDLWWKLRTMEPPVMPIDIAIRCGTTNGSVARYCRKRALDEGVTLPRPAGVTMHELRGKYTADIEFVSGSKAKNMRRRKA
jgi:hypothetical protein